jgi:hypothetical protein
MAKSDSDDDDFLPEDKNLYEDFDEIDEDFGKDEQEDLKLEVKAQVRFPNLIESYEMTITKSFRNLNFSTIESKSGVPFIDSLT